jgi:uncharacterized membrane protein
MTVSLHETYCRMFVIISLSLSLSLTSSQNDKCVKKKVVEKIKTCILFSVPFFCANRVLCEILLNSMVGPVRPQMTIYYRAEALHSG